MGVSSLSPFFPLSLRWPPSPPLLPDIFWNQTYRTFVAKLMLPAAGNRSEPWESCIVLGLGLTQTKQSPEEWGDWKDQPRLGDLRTEWVWGRARGGRPAFPSTDCAAGHSHSHEAPIRVPTHQGPNNSSVPLAVQTHEECVCSHSQLDDLPTAKTVLFFPICFCYSTASSVMSREENRTISRKGIPIHKLREPELTQGKAKTGMWPWTWRVSYWIEWTHWRLVESSWKSNLGEEAKSRCWMYLPVDWYNEILGITWDKNLSQVDSVPIIHCKLAISEPWIPSYPSLLRNWMVSKVYWIIFAVKLK